MNVVERNTLVVKHLPMVKKLAFKMLRQLPHSVDVDDLIQVGTIGVMRAAELFDSSKGVQFQTYANHRVRGAMLDYLRDIDWQPRLSKRRKETPPHIGRLPLGVRDDSQDIEDDAISDPSFGIEQQDSQDLLTRGLDRMGKAMVLLYFVEGLSMREVGNSLGLSESRISQRMTLILAAKRAGKIPADFLPD
jgi:RNA polymerase sigma factor FliA